MQNTENWRFQKWKAHFEETMVFFLWLTLPYRSKSGISSSVTRYSFRPSHWLSKISWYHGLQLLYGLSDTSYLKSIHWFYGYYYNRLVLKWWTVSVLRFKISVVLIIPLGSYRVSLVSRRKWSVLNFLVERQRLGTFFESSESENRQLELRV